MDIPYEVTTSGYNIIIDLNTTSKNWNIEDFINYYCEKDHNPHYVRLKRVSRDLHTNPTTILTIASGNILSGAITNKIKNGSLQFKIDDELKVSTFYSNFEQVYKALRLKPTARFCSALVDLSTRRNFNWKILIDKCKKYSTIAYNCRTREEFIVMLKDVYNFNTRKEELKI